MSLCDPIPVRLSGFADNALSSISSRSGLKKAELIRIAVDAFLEKTEQSGVITQRHIVSSVVQESGAVYGGSQVNNQSRSPSVVPPPEGVLSRKAVAKPRVAKTPPKKLRKKK